jgi:hypothetical protein
MLNKSISFKREMKTIFPVEEEKDVGHAFLLSVASLFMRDLHSLLLSEA